MTAGPSWYDVLGVAPDASTDEVRTAWRSAIADLDPTDRRFSSLNQAAEVLLDRDRRAAYDDRLTSGGSVAVDLRKPTDDAPVGPAADSAVAPEADPATDPEADPDADPAAAPEPADAAPRRTVVPGWLLAGLAVVTLVVAGVALWVGAKVPSDQAVSDATSAAQSAAERAVVPILSYDAHHIEDSRTAAEQYLTSGYREKYDDVFDGIVRENAPATGTVTTAKLIRSSIVRASDDATRVEVFVLVDQTRTNKLDKRPVVFKDWVTITMQKVGGDWLVAGMRT